MSVWRTKSIEQSIADTDEPEYQLKKRLTWLDLTVFGVGVVIGAGIFTLTGRAAQAYAGPGIVLSFVIAGVCCALAALCYAEFASAVPVSGSAYTFSYASLGEIIAWIIGWDLLLELMLGAAVVAQGWSAYAQDLLDKLGITWPAGDRVRRDGRLRAPEPAGAAAGRRARRCWSPSASRSRCGSTWCWSAQGLHRAVRHHRRHRLHQRRQLRPVHPAGRGRRRRRVDALTPAGAADLRARAAGLRRRSASSPRRRSCSSPTSASTWWRPPPRRPRTRSATCRSASSARWRSARCSTWRVAWWSPAWSSTPTWRPAPRWPRRSSRSGDPASPR